MKSKRLPLLAAIPLFILGSCAIVGSAYAIEKLFLNNLNVDKKNLNDIIHVQHLDEEVPGFNFYEMPDNWTILTLVKQYNSDLQIEGARVANYEPNYSSSIQTATIVPANNVSIYVGDVDVSFSVANKPTLNSIVGSDNFEITPNTDWDADTLTPIVVLLYICNTYHFDNNTVTLNANQIRIVDSSITSSSSYIDVNAAQYSPIYSESDGDLRFSFDLTPQSQEINFDELNFTETNLGEFVEKPDLEEVLSAIQNLNDDMTKESNPAEYDFLHGIANIDQLVLEDYFSLEITEQPAGSLTINFSLIQDLDGKAYTFLSSDTPLQFTGTIGSTYDLSTVLNENISSQIYVGTIPNDDDIKLAAYTLTSADFKTNVEYPDFYSNTEIINYDLSLSRCEIKAIDTSYILTGSKVVIWDYTDHGPRSDGKNWSGWISGTLKCDFYGDEALIYSSDNFEANDLVIPDEVWDGTKLCPLTSIYSAAFISPPTSKPTKLTGSLIIGNNIKLIKSHAFGQSGDRVCSSVNSLTIPSSLWASYGASPKIEEGAFAYLGSGVTSGDVNLTLDGMDSQPSDHIWQTHSFEYMGSEFPGVNNILHSTGQWTAASALDFLTNEYGCYLNPEIWVADE